jgi:signal peptidase I
MLRKRSAVLAGLANLIAPPLGHVYIGSPVRGLKIFASGLFLLTILGWCGAATSLWSFYLAQGLYLSVMLALIIDAAVVSLHRKEYELKPYNRWYTYIFLLLLIIGGLRLLVTFRFLMFGFDSNHFVSSNMVPAIEQGDFIASDTREFRFGAIPKRNDVITFRYPKNPSITYVQRVVGLPGERISINNGVVIIDGLPLDEPYVPATVKQQTFSLQMRDVNIPENAVFVLGDNRDHSNDSRFWGTLPVSMVIGKVTLVWFSGNTSRVGLLLQ